MRVPRGRGAVSGLYQAPASFMNAAGVQGMDSGRPELSGPLTLKQPSAGRARRPARHPVISDRGTAGVRQVVYV